MAWRQRETFPGADIVVLSDSGHFPYADNPNAVEQLLIGFLREQISD
jgi:pimeloyl-ACP methyl ester carboxylesterase